MQPLQQQLERIIRIQTDTKGEITLNDRKKICIFVRNSLVHLAVRSYVRETIILHEQIQKQKQNQRLRRRYSMKL